MSPILLFGAVLYRNSESSPEALDGPRLSTRCSNGKKQSNTRRLCVSLATRERLVVGDDDEPRCMGLVLWQSHTAPVHGDGVVCGCRWGLAACGHGFGHRVVWREHSRATGQRRLQDGERRAVPRKQRREGSQVAGSMVLKKSRAVERITVNRKINHRCCCCFIRVLSREATRTLLPLPSSQTI